MPETKAADCGERAVKVPGPAADLHHVVARRQPRRAARGVGVDRAAVVGADPTARRLAADVENRPRNRAARALRLVLLPHQAARARRRAVGLVGVLCHVVVADRDARRAQRAHAAHKTVAVGAARRGDEEVDGRFVKSLGRVMVDAPADVGRLAKESVMESEPALGHIKHSRPLYRVRFPVLFRSTFPIQLCLPVNSAASRRKAIFSLPSYALATSSSSVHL